MGHSLNCRLLLELSSRLAGLEFCTESKATYAPDQDDNATPDKGLLIVDARDSSQITNDPKPQMAGQRRYFSATFVVDDNIMVS